MREPTDHDMRAAANRLYGRDGELEIDPDAAVSRGTDPGAYVAAWVWVYFDAVTPEDRKRGAEAARVKP